jgi:SEC-C motif
MKKDIPNVARHPYEKLNLERSATIIVKQQQRNEPCGCGSGKKAKKCCGTEKDIRAIYPNPYLAPKKKPEPEPEAEIIKTLDDLIHD